MTKIDKKFIKNLQGKDFVLYGGLVELAHEKGLIGLESEMVHADYEKREFVFKATAQLLDSTIDTIKTFTSYGDANTSNVNKGIAVHIIRMADTRAKARCLRDACNVGMCSVEELGGSEPITGEKPKDTTPDKLACSGKGCFNVCSQKVHDYSMDVHKKVLCMNCQKKFKEEQEALAQDALAEEVPY